MANYNDSYAGIIQLMVDMGFSICTVDMGEKCLYFLTKSFEKPSVGAVSASPYIRIEGWDITEKMPNLLGFGTNRDHLKASLEKIKTDTKSMIFEKSDKYLWDYYTSF